MKVDENIRSLLLERLEALKKNIVSIEDDTFYMVKNAETVEEIMKAKKDLLVLLVGELPIFADACYFCLVNMGKHGGHALDKGWCTNVCPYAETHGACHEASDWCKLTNARENLKAAVGKYYVGEKYD